MDEVKQITIDDFVYTITGPDSVTVESYIGPTGPGSVATLPESIEIDGHKIETIANDYTKALEGTNIEKLVILRTLKTPVTLEDYFLRTKLVIAPLMAATKIESMPILKCVEVYDKYSSPLLFIHCPQIDSIIFDDVVAYGVLFDSKCKDPSRIEYRQGVITGGVDLPSFTHIVFGDKVENVGSICGGHFTFGKSVKKVHAMKKAEFGIHADTTVAEYELPTRIDFLSPTPPTVEKVAAGSINLTEIHVPAGALDTYMSHPQWGKAAYFVDADGNVVDKYASRHKSRMKKLQKEREAASEAAKRD